MLQLKVCVCVCVCARAYIVCLACQHNKLGVCVQNWGSSPPRWGAKIPWPTFFLRHGYSDHHAKFGNCFSYRVRAYRGSEEIVGTQIPTTP